MDQNEEIEVRQALRRIVAVADLEDAAVGLLATVAELRSYAAGTILFAEGDTHDRIYFICDGSIALDMVTANCGKQRILTVGGGDLLAWSALIGDQVMTATAVATEDVRAIVFQADRLKKLLEENCELGYHMMRVVAKALSRRLLATRLQLLDLYRA